MNLLPLAAFAVLLALVQIGAVAGLDATGLGWLDGFRPGGLDGGFNWFFRLGFAQVDAAIALGWSIWLVARRRSLAAGVPPLVLFLVVGVEVGLRLVVNQPAPGTSYELRRGFADQPLGHVLDTADLASRQTFVAATASPGQPAADRGSFPSGHAARSLFLALLGVSNLRSRLKALSRMARRRAVACASIGLCFLTVGLVSYSALFFGYHWPSDVLGGWLLAIVGWRLTTGLGSAPILPSWLRFASARSAADR